MNLLRSLLIVTLTVALFGLSAAAQSPVTSDTVLYLDFAGSQGEPIAALQDPVSGLTAVGVQVAPTSLVFGEPNPVTGKGSAYYDNPSTGNQNGSYLYIADHPAIDFAGVRALTFELFVRPESAKLAVLLRKTQPGGEDGYLITLDAEGRVIFQLQSPYERKQIRTGPGAAPVGKWTHIAATWDGRDMRIYIDGEERATGTFADVLDGTDGHLGIGALVRDVNRSSWGQIFHGSISQIRISKAALFPEDFLK